MNCEECGEELLEYPEGHYFQCEECAEIEEEIDRRERDRNIDEELVRGTRERQP